ncbi:MAG: lysylphosphatidylglycerol synthase transmembrane domain-containing protein [Pseudomonadota bacterium]
MTDQKKKKSLKAKILWLIKFTVSSAIVVLILRKILMSSNLGDIKDMLTRMPASHFALWMAGAFAVKGTGMFMAVVRWRILLNGQGLRIGWWHLIGSFLIGRFIGSFTPSTTGLDGWRLYDIARHAKNTAASVSVILVEKITGFFILSVLILATLPLGSTIIRNEGYRQSFEKASTIIVVVMGLPMAVALAMIMKPSIIRKIVVAMSRLTKRFEKKLLKFADALSAYENRKLLLLKALAAGFCVHLGTCGMYYFTGHSLGFDVSLKAVYFIGPIMIAATIVPVSIAGVGVRELVWAVLIGEQLGGGDVGFASGAVMAFLGYVVGEGISLAGGPIWLARRADYRMMKEMKEKQEAAAADGEAAPAANT